MERVRSPENSSSRSSGVSCTSPSSRESPVDSGYGYGSVACGTMEDLRRLSSVEEAPFRTWENREGCRTSSVGGQREDPLWRQGHQIRSPTPHSAATDAAVGNDT